MGESIISVSTSHIKFTPLCKSLSPKCKRTSINLSPKFVFTLRCYISSELREPPNEREETRTPMTSFDTNDVSNDVILTNHTQDTMMTFLASEEYFLWSRNPRNLYFHRRRTQFCSSFHSERVDDGYKFHGNRR